MLPQNRRLKKELIKETLQEGKVVKGTNISLKYSPFPGQLTSFAFIIPLKTAKRAINRNRLKRRARLIVFQLLTKIKEGYSVLLFFGKGSEEMKFPELQEEIEQLLKKTGLFQYD